MYDNPNGAATMPSYQASEEIQPVNLGGLAARMVCSNPQEPGLI